MKNLEEKFVSRKEIFDGHVLHVVLDDITLPSGKAATREICLLSGAVAIVPILPDGRVIMEWQYRYAYGGVMLEVPAGKLDSPDEIPLEAAKRELREETGAIAGKMTYLGEIVTSPALISEVIHLYLAEDLTFGECELDEDEFLEVEYIPLSDLKRMVMNGEIPDAKTQIAILKADEILKNR